jgi:hypothetical protein
MLPLKTVFVITVLTSRMIMPGMPDMSKIPGYKGPAIGAPTRTMRMDLTSDKKVDAKSTAQCAVPEGMLLGPKVDLQIDLPVVAKPTPEGEAPEGKGGEVQKFTIKMYWYCGESVAEGQPRVLDSDAMLKGMGVDPAKMQQMMKSMPRGGSLVDDTSHAYWPGDKAKPIKDESHTPGQYDLTTNYCGGTSVAFAETQDFLAPIELVQPGKGKIDLEKTIQLEWKPVPNALAYILTAFAGKEHEMVMWTSASDPDAAKDFMTNPLSGAQLKTLLDNGVLLQPTKTDCRIPAGIFKDMGMPMLTVTAIGEDKVQEKDGIRTVITVRSTATAMLAAGMGQQEEQTPEDTPTEATSSDSATTDTTSTTTDQSNTDRPKPNKTKDTINKLKGIFGH